MKSNLDAASVATCLREAGYAWVDADVVRGLLSPAPLRDWPSFATSWDDLAVDAYLIDHRRFRRRRHAVYGIDVSGTIRREAHQPHYQSRDYNALNGGIERWFQPITDVAANHPALQAILRFCFELFNDLTPAASRPAAWHVECHQFRIEARTGEHGQPTPEGLHRDGVDWVLVMLVTRENIAEGVTSIHDASKALVGRFTLTRPLDSAFVDDSRVYHGVTAVVPIDASRPAYRDVLVVTFRRA